MILKIYILIDIQDYFFWSQMKNFRTTFDKNKKIQQAKEEMKKELCESFINGEKKQQKKNI